MKPADLSIKEIFNRLFLSMSLPAANQVGLKCNRPIDRQVFVLPYSIDLNLHIK